MLLFIKIHKMACKLFQNCVYSGMAIRYYLHLDCIDLYFCTVIANTHMCLLYDISIVFNSVPLSLDLTVEGPRP